VVLGVHGPPSLAPPDDDDADAVADADADVTRGS
jgi:hypothetical protein